MKPSPRTQRTIDTLLDAINNGTLAAGTCTACAVGNIIAKAIGGEIHTIKTRNGIGYVCTKENHGWYPYISRGTVGRYDVDATSLIDKCPFNDFELAEIEDAFEVNTKIEHAEYFLYPKEEIKQDQINGLHAVIEVLKGFDRKAAAEQNKTYQDFDVNEVFTSKVVLA